MTLIQANILIVEDKAGERVTLCGILEEAGYRVIGLEKGADALIAMSKPGPDVIKPEWVREMADKAIVFACANPVPEIYPYAAKEAGAYITATGRGDFDNQVKNSLLLISAYFITSARPALSCLSSRVFRVLVSAITHCG